MRIELEGEASIEPFTADGKGRITLGSEYANQRVLVAVLERIDERSSAVPDELPRFDYKGSDKIAEDVKKKRAALVTDGSAGDPYWMGTAVADDTEVGINSVEYKQNLLITGMVESSRQAAIRAQYQQALVRGRGALVYDAYTHNLSSSDESPYRTIAREVGREEDVIEIDLDNPKSASFNIFEMGDETLENLDSPRAAEEIEEIVDQFAHLGFTANIGREGYWGPKMDAILRNIVRSAAKAGLSPTIQDICDVLSNGEIDRPDGETLSEDRRNWLTEARTTVEEDIEQSEWEPVFRRLRPWIDATAVRRAISNPDPTFSVEQAVRQGKIILITGENTGREKAQVAIAASQRAWAAQQEVQHRDEEEPIPFTLFAAGFHNLANAHIKLAALPSLSRAYEFTVAASAPATMSFDNPDEIVGHFGTYLTFAASERMARKEIQHHSRDVTQKDLKELPADVGYLAYFDGAESIKTHTLLPTV